MANLTLTIDDEILLQARKRALEQGTSVNAVVREYLASYTGTDASLDARRELVRLSEERSASSGAAGRAWRRDELHER